MANINQIINYNLKKKPYSSMNFWCSLIIVLQCEFFDISLGFIAPLNPIQTLLVLSLIIRMR
jgi:hypothetical protein